MSAMTDPTEECSSTSSTSSSSATSLLSSWLLNSNISASNLGASAWNRQKAKQPIQGKPMMMSSSFFDGGNKNSDNGSIKKIKGSSKEEDDDDAITANNSHNNNVKSLLKKRIYTSALKRTTENDGSDNSMNNNNNNSNSLLVTSSASASSSQQRQKSELEKAVLMDCLSSNALFSHCHHDTIEYMVESTNYFEKVCYRNHEVIIKQGSPCNYLYVLYSGQVVMEKDGKKQEQQLRHNKEKYLALGELSMLTGSPYDFTVKSISDDDDSDDDDDATMVTTTMFRLHRNHIQQLLQQNSSLSQNEESNNFTKNNIPTLEEIVKLLKQEIPEELCDLLLDDMPTLTKIASKFICRNFHKDDILVEKTQKLNALVIIAKGRVMSTETTTNDGRSYEDQIFGPAGGEDINKTNTSTKKSSFGWQSILEFDNNSNNNTPSEQHHFMGKMVALTDGIALIINQKSFLDALGLCDDHLDHDQKESSSSLLHQLASKRYARIQLEQIPIFQDSCLNENQIHLLLGLMHSFEYTEGEVIIQRGSKVEAAMYFVRQGSVEYTIGKGNDAIVKVVSAGGYFNEKNMLLDQNKDGHKSLIHRSPMHCIALSSNSSDDNDDINGDNNNNNNNNNTTKVDVLYLSECRNVINTTKLGLGAITSSSSSSIDESIQWKDIQRHTLIGAGSFGQVWLASTTTSSIHERTVGTNSDNDKDHRHNVFALKVQSKEQIIQANNVTNIVGERNILATLSSPFIIRLYQSFQDYSRLFIITSLLQGGELESIIPPEGLSENAAKFYAAGILEGLTHMHRRHIIHRDVKAENVLLNDKGYPVLIDLGFAKYVPDKTFTFCGTPMYTAPEIIRMKGHDKGCDHWSWGVLLYKLVTGRYPFYDGTGDELAMYKRICSGRFELDGHMSVDFRTLVSSILYPDPTQRLGSKIHGWKDIFSMPWFDTTIKKKGQQHENDDGDGGSCHFDLSQLRNQELIAPWVPELHDPLDASKFVLHDASLIDDLLDESLPTTCTLTREQQDLFDTFGKYV